MRKPVQHLVLQVLRSVEGRARTIRWIAGKVFNTDPKKLRRAQMVSVGRALRMLAAEPFCIVEKKPPLARGGARWNVRGYLLPPSLQPKPPKWREPPPPKYVPSGWP